MKYKKLFLTAAALVLFSGCADKNTADELPVQQTTSAIITADNTIAEQKGTETQRCAIEGAVMSCTNGILFILSDCNGSYHELCPIAMSAADGDGSIFDGLATGDRIKIEIELVEETYPAHTYVYSLEKTGQGSLDDIPAELITRLGEMGYTAETANEEKPERTELCMIDGVVYYNTGETNNVPRCGTLDGKFKVISENEYPGKEGEANFISHGNGFQWGMEAHTIEVCIDQNWYVFKPLAEPEVNIPAEDLSNSGNIKADEITPLSKDEDLQIRTDYAAYVSAGQDGSRDVTADDVYGKFYFGTSDGYKIVVMCPSEVFTCDIGVHRLRCTDADIIDPSCDCYPYIDIELPSGMFELLAYKDNTFTPVEKALEEGYLDYSAARMIGDQMEAYYQGSKTCVYSVS